MKRLHILCIASPYIYSETIAAVSDIFIKSGWCVTTEMAFKKDPEEKGSNDANMVFKAQRPFHPSRLPTSAVNILFQSEQFSKLREFHTMPYSEPWDLILDVFSDNLSHIPSPSNIRFLPVGYHEAFGSTGGLSDVPKTDAQSLYDYYLFGAGTKYRRWLWKVLVEARYPQELQKTRNRFANADLDGTKNENILRSKINIFINAWEPYLLPMMHCSQILSKGKFLIVVGDTPNRDHRPFLPGVHFVETTPKEFQTTADKWIVDEEGRMSFAQNALSHMMKHLCFSRLLKDALNGYIDL